MENSTTMMNLLSSKHLPLRLKHQRKKVIRKTFWTRKLMNQRQLDSMKVKVSIFDIVKDQNQISKFFKDAHSKLLL